MTESEAAARAIAPSVIAGVDFAADAVEVARALIGVTLLVDGAGGRIVETEAYDESEPASHGFRGMTSRNKALFGPPACAYVYLSYGLHWCLNFVCREEGHGAGVLLRALEPLAGIDLMRERRGVEDIRLLCAGPGRLGQALGITRAHDGLPLDSAPFKLEPSDMAHPIVSGKRIGISQGKDFAWRFTLKGSRFLSKPAGG
jgi:DNA-3-methyladenine glycosylase